MNPRNKSYLKLFFYLEGTLVATSFLGFVLLRRNESIRRKTFENLPTLAEWYYSTEDLISFGQLSGRQLRHRDINTWYKDLNFGKDLDCD
ncbi:Hypothetical protein SRAE_1000322100 [Strongyloides ratti]|uniref:Uncharacterized protein n=1 Tax=Strongyloides ratti TaxID=34506 RepID=A0A090LA00_STRRB|nr:Hypothetical protein SRAE_1000322100 [Strongyloides ratti]CEF64968.1 Hypothetical protein SRAE_1000322100 [Strongyloides ratti]